MAQYVFEDSLNRIFETMKQSTPHLRESIPDNGGISMTQPCIVNATVVYVLVKSEGNSTQVMQSFLSESSRIVRTHSNCKDIVCFEDKMIIIYSSAYKAEIGYALDDAARIRSLSMVVSKFAKNRGFAPIQVKIGMDFGLVEMYRLDSDNMIPSFAWRGPAINQARKNAEDAQDELIITRAVWGNLSEYNQKLFTIQSVVAENYRGQLVNIMMNNWLNKSK